MRWFCWPMAVMVVALGTTAYGGNFNRYGRVVNDDSETYPTTNAPAAPLNPAASNVPGELVPSGSVVGGNAPGAQMPGSAMPGGPMPYGGPGSCNCGNGSAWGAAYGNGGGFMGFSWATGCCNAPSCCAGVWDNYASQYRSWCNKSHGHCGWHKGACNTGGCNTGHCGGGFCSNFGSSFAGPYNGACSANNDCGCKTGCRLHHKMHGFARSCMSLVSGNSCDSGSCGCETSGNISDSSNVGMPTPAANATDDMLPPEPAPVNGNNPAAPNKLNKEPEKPAPRDTQVPAKQSGKTASRTLINWKSMSFGAR